MTKTKQFRDLLLSPETEFILEAHNGISAKIGAEAGFKGLWASGLCISGQYGVRDSNEASWTQVLDMLEFMSDATSIPIMLDGDTGYGNFNSMRRLVRKLEQRDVAAVCIEDKLFPKTNSFIAGDSQPLADLNEFCGKIRAGKDGQADPDFSIVARVEAFIAGWGLGEALSRAHAYADAGADAILMHSAKAVPDEILAFMAEWDRECPVVVVPTKYHNTPTEVLRDAGVSMVIWANHMLRASVDAMQKTARTIAAEESLKSVEPVVVSVAEIFRLQGAHELAEAEKQYLPSRGDQVRAIVLAAGGGDGLGSLTEDRPKALIEVDGKSIASHIVDTYNATGIKDVTVVRGYRKDAFDLANVRYVDNDDFDSTGELVSLARALEALPDEAAESTLVCGYGDVLFGKYVMNTLLDSAADLAVCVDINWDSGRNDAKADLVECSTPYTRQSFNKPVSLRRVTVDRTSGPIHGEWMGFVKITDTAQPLIRGLVGDLTAADPKADVPDLLNALVADGHDVEVIYISGQWLDVDSLSDLARADAFAVESPAE